MGRRFDRLLPEGRRVVFGGDPQAALGVREGDVISGKYRVERTLGHGGMGVVFAARHIQLDEKVALKFLHPEALRDDQAVARFVREARAAVKIKSEHVARVTDVDTMENGTPYIVMEYLDGGDLAGWLRQQGALPIEQAVEFVLHACVAVAEAHGLGIIHRDLKPANLFCIRRADGQLSIKVLDFGISKRTDMTGTNPEMAMTQTGALMGSPIYMSPEQMRSSKNVGVGTDIWALGIILFELLAGRPPFVAQTVTELAIMVANEPIPALRSFRPEVPPGLEVAILRCLEKDPRERHRNIGELAMAILPFAPKRAKASVERISGIIQAAGLSESALAVPLTPPADGTKALNGTLPPAVGRTTKGGKRGKPAVLGVGALALAVVSTVTVAVLSRRAPEHRDEPQPASAHPPPVPSVSQAIVMANPPVPDQTTSVVPAPAPPTADSTDVVAAPAISVAPPSKPSKTPKTPPAASTAAVAALTTATPTPSCTVVTDYDSDGQPHFKKVCK